MNIIIYCLGEKALTSLNGLSDDYKSLISMIVIGEDKNVVDDKSSDIKKFAILNNINYSYRTSYVKNTSYDYHIAIGWRWMISLETDKKNLIVIHDSLLPKYRGFNPLVSALINGDTRIGASMIWASDEYDEGDIIFQEDIQVNYPIKILEAIQKISGVYAILLNRFFKYILEKTNLPRIAQDKINISYSLWRDENDYLIDWNCNASTIVRMIDAVGFPYLSASTNYDNRIIRIIEAIEVQEVCVENRTPGKIIFLKDNCPTIVCGTGLVKIIEATDADNKKVIFNKFRVKLI